MYSKKVMQLLLKKQSNTSMINCPEMKRLAKPFGKRLEYILK
jgi:hypothetical protein